MKHATIATMTSGGQSLGQYGVNPARYGSFGDGWPHFSRVLHVIGTWMDRRRQRLVLSSLDEPMLKDIGLTRIDVQREIEKPFWRP